MDRVTQNTREALAILEQFPELSEEPSVSVYGWAAELNWFVANVATMKQIRRELGGTWDKSADDYYYRLKQTVGNVKLEILASRNAVCEKVEVGTEEVVIPAVEAQEARIEVRPVYEYRCPESLAML